MTERAGSEPEPAGARPGAGQPDAVAPEFEILAPLRPERPGPEPEVGRFEQGTPASRWALARYLAGRAIGDSALRSLLLLVIGFVALAVLIGVLGGPTFLIVVCALVALGFLVVWAVARSILRRLTSAVAMEPIRADLERLVRDTRGDVRRELHRVGVPSTVITLPLLAARLLGRHRAATVARLRGFDITRVVPAARLDEVHLLLERLPR